MIFAILTGGLPNRITAVTVARVTFVPAGAFSEPGLIRYISVTARVMGESEAFAVALERVDRLSDISAEHDGEAVRAKSAVIIDVGAMPGADRRLSALVAELPRFRSKEIVTGRVVLKSTAPALGRLPGVVGRAELINSFNARAMPIASEDVNDPARRRGTFIASFRHYAPEDGDLSREEIQARLSAAERLDVRKLILENESLVELSDDETVAAGVMLTMVAADFYAPMGADRVRSFRLAGLARQ